MHMNANGDHWGYLVESIGLHAVQAVKKEHLASLNVLLDHRTAECNVTVELRDNSGPEQYRAMRALLELEELFRDDATLSFNFVEETEVVEDAPSRVSQRQYSFA